MHQQLLADIVDRLESARQAWITGLPSISSQAFFLSRFLPHIKSPALFVTEDPEVSEKMMNDFHIWSSDPAILLSDTEQQGEALAILAGTQSGVVFADRATFESVEVPSFSVYTGAFVALLSGARMSQVELFEHLISIGYEAEEGELSAKGKYYRRGGVVDIYLVNKEHPVRVEFFEDQIDSIFSFDILCGKKIEDLNEIVLYPVRVRSEAKKEGLESYLDNALLILDEVEDDFRPVASQTVVFTPFSNPEHETISMDMASVFRYHTPLDFVVDLQQKLEEDWEVHIFARDTEKVWNFLIEKEFTATDLDHVRIHGNGHYETWISQEDSYRREQTNLQAPDAFLHTDSKMLCITAREIFGASAGTSAAVNERVGAAFLADLDVGDLVVHVNHGIGRFQGISRNTFGDVEREYLLIEYAKGDKLYVPVDKAEKINRFIGIEVPTLTTLGSAEWDKISCQAKEESNRMAKELLDVYARRELAQGYSFGPDSDDQKKFEDEFEHELTPGQAKSIAEIKSDMESTKPMDRLLCGDVGFGKTEIAVRAAFKAVRDGKQVAFLAPITILADQQYKSFYERMISHGIVVEQLSRFRTPIEQERILQRLAAGEVHVVVGTHRLLQKDVIFKNLGLVVVDEEQRFGVKQKETLKEMRANVDILTLTATPIPRTLNMGLSGLRDISTITTPPPGRLPIHTEIRRFTYPLVRDVILREIERKGQIYYLHNRVSTIEGVAEKLRALVPQARILVTHGQLTPHELEARIVSFKKHEYDVLVSSTIIENGIDMANANTLIVDRAEAFGLSQAYQLRGRVGRSKTQAYAYFLYQAQQLQPDAKRRLKAISEASDLGCGFQIAMKDLDIRGAGELLGSRQHGAINTIGITHFTRMLHMAVEDLKASVAVKDFHAEVDEVTVDVGLSSFIPDSYIPETAHKLKWYQRISAAENDLVLAELMTEMITLFGPLPQEAINLFKLVTLKIASRESLVASIDDFNLEGVGVVDVLLSKQVTPKEIVKLLEYNSGWVVTGHKLRIEKQQLVTAANSRREEVEWIDELITCVKKLKQ